MLTSFVKAVLAQREAMLSGDEPHSSHHSEGVVDWRPDSLKTEINRRSAESSTKEKKMKANVSSILLGVGDMERTKRFYTEGLSWTIERDFGLSVFFALDGGPLVGFYGREGLAAEMGTSPEGSGFSGLALTYVVRTEERVDEILAEAEKAGAAILKPAAATPWGGYGGTFADPDGYIWSIGYSAQAKDQPYAE
jgi:predicted enzyme related to lactoylglutathione lyase